MAEHKHGWIFLLAAGFLFFSTRPCFSGDLSAQPFEVRLWSAMSRSISSTDAIGRQASVAFLSASSDNPAAADTRDVEGEESDKFLCAGTHHVVFSNGAWIAAGDANALVRMKNAGTILLGYNRIQLAEGQTLQGFDDNFSDNEFGLKYGRSIHRKAYVGIGFRIREMKLDYGDLYLGLPRDTRNHSLGGSFSAGTLWRPNRSWVLGLLTEAGWIRSDVEGQVHLPGPAGIPFQLDLTTQTVSVKAGLGWKATRFLTIYGDGQYYHVGNSVAGLDLGRFYFGCDLRVAHGLSFIAGGSVDNMAQASSSAGISLKISKPSLIKVTYQNNPFPEIRQEFGKGHLVSASVVFKL